MKNIYCICGPSGSGKSTLEKLLKDRHFMKPVVSHTTRPKRENETDGTGHFFVDKETFDALGEKVAYTVFDGYEYGVTKDVLDSCDLYVIDPDGIFYLKERVTDRKIVVFGLDPGPEVCAERMRERGDSCEKVLSRLEHDARIYKLLPTISNLMLDASLSPKELAEQVWALIRSYEGIRMSDIEAALCNYVTNDADAAGPEYVLETWEDCGGSRTLAEALGLDWIYDEEDEEDDD